MFFQGKTRPVCSEGSLGVEVLEPTFVLLQLFNCLFLFYVESRVSIPETTFVGVESRVSIPETTFVWCRIKGINSRDDFCLVSNQGYQFPRRLLFGVESRVSIPETTFVGVESRVSIPETTFVGVESRVSIPKTTFVGVIFVLLVYFGLLFSVAFLVYYSSSSFRDFAARTAGECQWIIRPKPDLWVLGIMVSLLYIVVINKFISTGFQCKKIIKNT